TPVMDDLERSLRHLLQSSGGGSLSSNCGTSASAMVARCARRGNSSGSTSERGDRSICDWLVTQRIGLYWDKAVDRTLGHDGGVSLGAFSLNLTTRQSQGLLACLARTS